VRERDTHTHRVRERERHTNTHTNTHTHSERERERERHTDTHTDTHTHRVRERERETHTRRVRERERDTQTRTQTHTYTECERERHTHTRTHTQKPQKMNPSCESCSICMEALCHHQQPVTLTTCNHEFHTTCLEQWTINFSNTSCPLCRAQIVCDNQSPSSSPPLLTRYQLEEEARSNAFIAARRVIREEFRFFR
jgi:hypothetical protein